MPGLLRGVARTAVVAGTASAVSGRVQRRQAEKFAGRDAEIYAARDQAYAQQTGYAPAPAPAQYVYAEPASPPPPAAPAVSQDDKIRQLKELGELRQQGVLNDAEFEAQKARILAS
jgi:hypothetical protein